MRLNLEPGADSAEAAPGSRGRRVTALVGPSGSGKTELAIALALAAASAPLARGEHRGRVALADLDVVKPYFRSREVRERLAAEGVALVAPEGELATADLPIVTADLRAAIADPDTHVVLDVGGDPAGARALGSLADVFVAADPDLLLVLNGSRPFMSDPERVVALARAIEAAAQARFTGVVSNTHLMEETTLELVLDGLELAREVAARLSVPLRALGVPEELAPALASRPGLPPLLVIHRHVLPTFLGGSIL